MSDPSTDTDFIKLSAQVEEGFADSRKDRTKIMEILTAHEKRLDQGERTIDMLSAGLVEQQEANRLIHQVLFGRKDGSTVGCQEIQRNIHSFLKTIKKLAWLIAAPLAALAVGGIVAIVRHILIS